MKICAFEWESVCGTEISPERLSRFGELALYGKPDPDEVEQLVGDAEIVLCSKVPFPKERLMRLPKLRYIGLTATGYNNVDVAAARELGITVTNIPDYSASAVTQMTMAYILQFATNLIRYDESVKAGEWQSSPLFCHMPHPLFEVEGKTLGLFGLGSIGSRVARAAEALGMHVIYHARSKKDVPWEFVSLEALLKESDILSLHAPLTAETEKLICAESLSQMKKGAYLVNTARGGLIDEEAVADALKSGRLSGYASDVLTVEPQRTDCPLIGAPGCLITPHVAWAPLETRQRLWDILEGNLEAFLAGKPRNCVS